MFILKLKFDQWNTAFTGKFQVQCLNDQFTSLFVVDLSYFHNNRENNKLKSIIDCLTLNWKWRILFYWPLDPKAMFKRNDENYLKSIIPKLNLSFSKLDKLDFYDEILDLRDEKDYFLDHICRKEVQLVAIEAIIFINLLKYFLLDKNSTFNSFDKVRERNCKYSFKKWLAAI